jgi:hypothetical protein
MLGVGFQDRYTRARKVIPSWRKLAMPMPYDQRKKEVNIVGHQVFSRSASLFVARATILCQARVP